MSPIRTDNVEPGSKASPLPNTSKAPKRQVLLQGLGVDATTLDKILEDVRIKSRKLFDATLVLKQQPEEVVQLEVMLLSAYPEVFKQNQESKLKLLHAYTQKYHTLTRHLLKHRREPSVKDEASGQISIPLPSGAPSRVSVPTSPRSHCIDLTGEDDNNETIYVPHPPTNHRLASPAPSQTSTLVASIPLASQALTGSGSTLHATPSPLPQTGGATSLVEYFSGTNRREVDGLRYFLRKFCDPPMECFLDRFLQYGCHSLAYLRPVKSWPIEVIDYFLRDLPKTNGREMTPMEVLVLRMHILNFPFDKAADTPAEIQSL